MPYFNTTLRHNKPRVGITDSHETHQRILSCTTNFPNLEKLRFSLLVPGIMFDCPLYPKFTLHHFKLSNEMFGEDRIKI